MFAYDGSMEPIDSELPGSGLSWQGADPTGGSRPWVPVVTTGPTLLDSGLLLDDGATLDETTVPA